MSNERPEPPIFEISATLFTYPETSIRLDRTRQGLPPWTLVLRFCSPRVTEASVFLCPEAWAQLREQVTALALAEAAEARLEPEPGPAGPTLGAVLEAAIAATAVVYGSGSVWVPRDGAETRLSELDHFLLDAASDSVEAELVPVTHHCRLSLGDLFAGWWIYVTNMRLATARGNRTVREAVSPRSLELFLAYALDAPNWSGTPLVGGNVGGSREDRGNLTQLKRARLVMTFPSDGETWLDFTDSGRELARACGIDLKL